MKSFVHPSFYRNRLSRLFSLSGCRTCLPCRSGRSSSSLHRLRQARAVRRCGFICSSATRPKVLQSPMSIDNLPIVTMSMVPFRFIYQFCENIKEKPDGEIQFETKSWCPVDLGLQDISHDLVTQVRTTRQPRSLAASTVCNIHVAHT